MNKVELVGNILKSMYQDCTKITWIDKFWISVWVMVIVIFIGFAFWGCWEFIDLLFSKN